MMEYKKIIDADVLIGDKKPIVGRFNKKREEDYKCRKSIALENNQRIENIIKFKYINIKEN